MYTEKNYITSERTINSISLRMTGINNKVQHQENAQVFEAITPGLDFIDFKKGTQEAKDK